MKLIISPSQQTGIEEPLIKPIAQRLYDILKSDNLVDVLLVPYFTCTDELALWNAIQWENANSTSIDKILAIHADAGGYAKGASGLYYSQAGKNFIAPILQGIMDITPTTSDAGIKYRGDLGELKRTNAVAGLIELAFYDNSEELAWMKNNTELIAQTLKSGVYKSLGIIPRETNDLKIALVLFKKDLEKMLEKLKLLEV